MAGKAPIPKVWQEALSSIQANSAITVAGASGQCVGQINGIYELRKPRPGDAAPSFQRRDGSDVWLYFAGDQRWWISSAKSKDARASSGWAYSRPVDPGTLPTALDSWSLIQQSGEWEDHTLEIAATSLEAALASAAAAWRQAARHAEGAPAMIVRGARGVRASLVNGTFVLAEPTPDGAAPAFRSTEFDDTWLYLAIDGRWWISSTERKNGRQASGWAFSLPVAAGILPSKTAGWRVTLGDGQFTGQTLKIESHTLEEADTFQATSWSRAVRALRAKKQKLAVVKGAKGPNAPYINGVYDMQPDPEGVLAPSFANRDFDNVSLYYCSDQRWWVKQTASCDAFEPREPGGWACSRQCGRGTMPHKAGGWKVAKPGGTWKPQDWEVEAMTEEEKEEYFARLWRESFSAVLGKPVIDICGATGDNAALVNGTYKLSITGDVGKPPLFRKQGEVDTWLYFAGKGRTWWVSSTKFKDARQPAGWAHTDIVDVGTLPSAVEGWTVFAGDGAWEPQALQLVARSCSEPFAHAAGAWRRSYSDMINLPVVEITGASGELGSINGAYDLRPSYIDKGTLIFQNRVHEGIWLYPGKDSRWWVSDSTRKDNRDAGGYACSEPVELGTPPTVAGGWKLCHGGRRWEPRALKIRAKSFEDLHPVRLAAWKGAADALRSAPTMRISGAAGDSAAAINGVYELQPSIVVGTPPVFRERDDRERWLYFVSKESSWWIGNTRNKTRFEAKGWARSGRVELGTLPSAAGGWKASNDNGDWHEQPQLRVEAEARSAEALADAEGGPLEPAATLSRSQAEALRASPSQTALAGPLAPNPNEVEFILDNSSAKTATLGLRHCLSRNINDVHDTLVTPWDCSVKGVASDDGWVMCADGTFLPVELNGRRVMHRKVELDFLLDNNARKDESNGMRHRLSRSLDDLHPTAHSFWGSWVQGIDLGDGWLRLSGSGMYLPMALDGIRVLIPEPELTREYVLDNSRLKATTKGMRHRQTRDLDDFHPTAHTRWGEGVTGADSGDGWIRLAGSQLYLPRVVDGISVLVPREEWEAEHPNTFDYVADNNELGAGSKGLRHRQSKNMEDVHRHANTKWGSIVTGADVGDGWLRTVEGLFLPFVVDGARVLLTVEEAAAAEAARREAAAAAEAAAASQDATATATDEGAAAVAADAADADAAQLESGAAEDGAVAVAALADTLQPDAVAKEEAAPPTDAAQPDTSAVEEAAAASAAGAAPQPDAAAAAGDTDREVVVRGSAATAVQMAAAVRRVSQHQRPEGEPLEGFLYLADNGLLGASTAGIQHRRTRRLKDAHPTEGTPWGSVVQGVDTGDGWIRVYPTGRFVPKTLDGVGVLVRLVEAEFRADNSLLQAPTFGVQHRHTKDLRDVIQGEGSRTTWGTSVRGVDLGDGWLRLPNGHYLPTSLDGVPVLIRRLAVDDMVLHALPSMPSIPKGELVPVPKFGLAA